MARVTAAVSDGVGWVTIDRPEALNALDSGTLDDLDHVLDELERDDTLKVIVFRGAGERAFIAGGDIADLGSRTGLEHYGGFAEQIHRLFRRIELLDVPTICAIQGYALGGGVEFMLATDIRILGESARLGLPEITLGLFPGAGGSQRLPRQIPVCAAKYLMFTGEQVDAEAAVALGLANEVVADADLYARAADVAAAIAGKSRLVLKLLKRAIEQGLQMPLPSALAHEQAVIGLVLDTEDAHEGCTAFIEKRRPIFTDR